MILFFHMASGCIFAAETDSLLAPNQWSAELRWKAVPDCLLQKDRFLKVVISVEEKINFGLELY